MPLTANNAPTTPLASASSSVESAAQAKKLKKPPSLMVGAGYLLLGELFLALMMAVIKKMGIDGYGNHTLVFYRNVFGLITLLPIIFWINRATRSHSSETLTDHPIDQHHDKHAVLGQGAQTTGPFHLIALFKSLLSHLKTECIHLHLFRAASGLSAMYCFFYIISHIPLAEATLVKLSTPFFLPIVAMLWLGESIQTNHKVAILIGFIGVAIILQPGSDQFHAIGLLGLLGALLAATAKVTIRRMGKSEPSTRTVFYFATFATLFSAVPAIAHPELPSGLDWGWFLLMGLLGTAGQISLTFAYKSVNPGKIGPYTYASILYASILGWLFWGETLALTTLLGSALIILSGWINLKMTR